MNDDDKKYDEITTYNNNVAGVQNIDVETKKLKEEMSIEMEQKYTKIPSLMEALKDPKYKGLKLGFIGSGAGGSRLTQEFYLHGYKHCCCFNTAKQDLFDIKLPPNNKLHLDYGLGGAGKDMELGEEAAQENSEQIEDLIKRCLGDGKDLEVDMIIITIGLGGGTGTGSLIPLVSILSQFKIPVLALVTLPMQNEGAVAKHNAVVAMNKASKLTQNNFLSGLIIVDNSKIEETYPNSSISNFYKQGNFDIAMSLNLFNTITSFPTSHTAMDPTDFTRIICSNGCTIYGKVEIPVTLEKDENGQEFISLEEDEIAQSLKYNLKKSLLAEGFNLSEAVRAGVVFTGKKEVLDKLPAVYINFAMVDLSETMGRADFFKGVYVDEDAGDMLKVYILISGLGIPKERIQRLAQEAQIKMNEMEEEEADKTKMDVSDVLESSKEQNTYDKIRKKKSSFGKIVSGRKNKRSRR